MKSLKESIVNESLSITDGEKELLLRSLYELYRFAMQGEISLSDYEAEREIAPLYKKIFSTASKAIQSDKDFGNGDISKARNLSFWE